MNNTEQLCSEYIQQNVQNSSGINFAIIYCLGVFWIVMGLRFILAFRFVPAFRSDEEFQEDEELLSRETEDTIIPNIGNVVMIQAKSICNLTRLVKKLSRKKKKNSLTSTENQHSTEIFDSPIEILESSEEITDIFDEEHKRQNRSVQDVLDIGRNIGAEPVKYYSQKGGGYATNRDIEKHKRKFDKFKKNKLSRADELDIMRSFIEIRGMNYYEAMDIVEGKGYELHPIYVNNGEKRKAITYKGTIIGVSVADTEYDMINNIISKRATITNILDVGGQDEHNRGGNFS